MAKKPARKAHPEAASSKPAVHLDLQPLFDALVKVSWLSNAIARCYSGLLALKESRGLPKADEWPNSQALERKRAQHAEWVKAERDAHARRGESVVVADFLESPWTELLREWSEYFQDWCDAIAKAKELVRSPAVAAIMDAGEPRLAHRWTAQTIINLDNLAGTLHPVMGGVDGLGFIRCGLPTLPQDFRTHAEAVRNRIGELRSIPISTAPSAAAKALSDCVTLTADHVSILTVLGKNPMKCKTVIEVSSAGTIRNRETVGRLLGELAGFGLVHRPYGKRKGYALTDAGRKQLPVATPT